MRWSEAGMRGAVAGGVGRRLAGRAVGLDSQVRPSQVLSKVSKVAVVYMSAGSCVQVEYMHCGDRSVQPRVCLHATETNLRGRGPLCS